MAVIHISEEEAAKDFLAVAKKASDGEEFVIEGGAVPLRLSRVDTVPSQTASRGRLLSEILASMASRSDSAVILDDRFGDDLEAVIKSHEHERLIDPWESF